MDVKLKPFDFAQAVARSTVSGPNSATAAGRAAAPQGDFSQVMAQALRNVSQAQHQSDQLQRDVALDSPTASIEDTMLAMQRSQIGFQMALQVRNRLVQAYSDVMNIQV
jgi:flagellar hook-basal body complex protein FliE